MMENFDAKVESFRCKLEAMLAEHRIKNKNVSDSPIIKMEHGSKYIRIVFYTCYGNRTVYGFIDKTNGDLLKAASWKVPAKTKRGSIFNENPLDGCNEYGMVYLR
jgi:hypothetical protein